MKRFRVFNFARRIIGETGKVADFFDYGGSDASQITYYKICRFKNFFRCSILVWKLQVIGIHMGTLISFFKLKNHSCYTHMRSILPA